MMDVRRRRPREEEDRRRRRLAGRQVGALYGAVEILCSYGRPPISGVWCCIRLWDRYKGSQGKFRPRGRPALTGVDGTAETAETVETAGRSAETAFCPRVQLSAARHPQE